jgi:hypothetical protein
MAASRVIDSYLAELGRRLPVAIADELADGVEQTYLHYQSAGLGDEQSARAALQEFGAVDTVVASFVTASPARQTARRLLAVGPLVGACWAAVLLIGKAWSWPIPAAGRFAFGAALVAIIGTLIAAVAGRDYWSTGRAATAGCLGLLVLDAVMLFTVMAWAGLPPRLLALGACASGTRMALTLHCLPRILGSIGLPSWPVRRSGFD